MILKSFCPHCDTEDAGGDGLCPGCGALADSTLWRAEELEPGYELYQNSWRGFATVRPQGWACWPAKESKICLSNAERTAQMELLLLPPSPSLSARHYSERYLQALPQHRAEVLQDSSEQVQAVLRGSHWAGGLSVHLTAQGGTLACARAELENRARWEEPLRQLLSQVQPIPVVSCQRWVEPQEAPYTLQLPMGWQCQSRFASAPTLTGLRQPTARIFAQSSVHILLALEPEYQLFGPDELVAFSQSRLSLAGAPSANDLPTIPAAASASVLRAAVERVYWPRWQRAMPGSRLLSFQDHGRADAAEVRILLPGEMLRVVKMKSFVLSDREFKRSQTAQSCRWPDPLQPNRTWANLREALSRQRSDERAERSTVSADAPTRRTIGALQMAGWRRIADETATGPTQSADGQTSSLKSPLLHGLDLVVGRDLHLEAPPANRALMRLHFR